MKIDERDFGLRRQAERDAAFEPPANVESDTKALSPLRSASAVQNDLGGNVLNV